MYLLPNVYIYEILILVWGLWNTFRKYEIKSVRGKLKWIKILNYDLVKAYVYYFVHAFFITVNVFNIYNLVDVCRIHVSSKVIHIWNSVTFTCRKHEIESTFQIPEFLIKLVEFNQVNRSIHPLLSMQYSELRTNIPVFIIDNFTKSSDYYQLCNRFSKGYRNTLSPLKGQETAPPSK